MIELPPLDDELPLPPPMKYKVPFRLTEDMLCYGTFDNGHGRMDLTGWLDVVNAHYNSQYTHALPGEVYHILLKELSNEFPGLDFDCISLYCDSEQVCPRSRLIAAWRAFLANMNWDECDEPKPNPPSRQQKRKRKNHESGE